MLIILALVFLYWFITMMIQLGISAANIEDEEEDKNTLTVYCMAIFAGWIFVPIFIGEALGLYIHKAIKERYS